MSEENQESRSEILKDGDKVVGEPSEPDMAKKHPIVVGYYNLHAYEFMDEMYQQEFVMVGTTAVSCDNIRPAHRRDKETVFNDE